MWPKTLFLAYALTLMVLPITSVMAQEVEDKAKAETDGAAAAQDAKNAQEAEGKKEKPAVKLRLAEIAIWCSPQKVGQVYCEKSHDVQPAREEVFR